MQKNEHPKLNTHNLFLRRLTREDFPSLIHNLSNPKVSDQIFNIPYPYTEDDASKRLEFIRTGYDSGERFMFAIVRKEDEQLVGEMGLHLTPAHNHAQLGYYIGEDYWGKGYASEALGAIIQFGFETLQLNKIFATHYENNPASGKVMQKNNMKQEGFLLNHYRVGNEYRSVYQYQILRNQFLINKK